jgi:hypothetical protein
MQAEKTSTRLRRSARAKNQAAGKDGHHHQSGNHLFVSSLTPFDRTVGIILAHNPRDDCPKPDSSSASTDGISGRCSCDGKRKNGAPGTSNAKFKHGQK